MITTPRRALGALLVISALLAAGCGSEDDAIETETPPATSVSAPPTTAPPETTAPPPTTADGPDSTDTDGSTDGGDAIAYDDSPDTALLHLATGGGFVPMEYHFTEIPSLIVYGDGRVLRSGEMDFTGAIRPVEELQLDEEGVQALLAAAKEAGLLSPGTIEYGSPGVTDMPGTSLTLSTADGSVTHSAYALGFNAPEIEGEEPMQDGLTDEQRAARKVLQGFIEQVEDLDTLASGHVSEPEPYVLEEVAVQAFAAFEDATEGEMKPWPVDEVDPPPLDTCTVVSGPAAAAAAEALATASNATTWTLSGRAFRAAGRPILPGEEGCAA
jgi:hypothetical protein